MSVFPSLPAVCRHLRPGVATLRRADLGLELAGRGSMPGFGLAGPVMFMAWDSQWLNLVFAHTEDNAPPAPAGAAIPAMQVHRQRLPLRSSRRPPARLSRPCQWPRNVEPHAKHLLFCGGMAIIVH